MNRWRRFIHYFGIHTSDENNFCVFCGKPVWNKYREQQKKWSAGGSSMKFK